MALKTATEIIDQAMQQAGNTRIQTWCLDRLNTLLRALYRSHRWPFLEVYDETLATTASQAYTDYSGLGNTLWRPMIVQIKSGTSLYEVTPLRGGWAAYIADTARLVSTGRPAKYVLDRRTSRFYWADSIPTAAETIALLYQVDATEVDLAATPHLVRDSKAGEQYCIKALVAEIKERMEQYQEAKILRDEVKRLEDAILSERMDDQDATPETWGNAAYV